MVIDVSHLASNWAADYTEAKVALAEHLGATEALLHVHAGLMIFIVAALLVRTRTMSVWPVIVVAAFAIINEVADFVGPNSFELWRSAVDVLNTLVWPIVLFLVARSGGEARRKA